MAYFKINDVDYSNYVKELSIKKAHNYKSQTNAAGDTVVDYINSKRSIKVGLIAITDAVMPQILEALDNFNVSISFRDPKTNFLAENVNCIIPSNEVEYYTIQANKVMFNGFNLTFTEL